SRPPRLVHVHLISTLSTFTLSQTSEVTMTTHLRHALVPILSLALGSAAALAANPPAAAPAAPAAKGGFQGDLLALVDDVEKKTLSLEEAVPQNKFTWRPAPGVRSIAEAYMHIAFGNYGLTKLATGKEPPAEVG